MSSISMTWPQYQRGECVVDGVRVYLAPLRAEMLALFLMRRGCLISTTDLVDFCWPDPDHMPDAPEENVKVHVFRLRQQIPSLIETIHGRGYRIALPSERQLAA